MNSEIGCAIEDVTTVNQLGARHLMAATRVIELLNNGSANESDCLWCGTTFLIDAAGKGVAVRGKCFKREMDEIDIDGPDEFVLNSYNHLRAQARSLK
jgi:hypothetical protein